MSQIHFPLLLAVALVALVLMTWLAKRPKKYRYRGTPIMTATEERFFRQLTAALPNLWIFPQVAFTVLLQPKATGKEYWAAWGRMAQKRVDFALYDSGMNLIVVLELDGPSHDGRATEDRQRDALLQQVGIRVLRFDVRRWPRSKVIHAAVFPSDSDSARLPAN
jgi:Zn-dependent protease